MTDRRPYHLGVLLGLSAAAYAGTLAVVTAEQAAADSRVAAARDPILQVVDALRVGNERLERGLAVISHRSNTGLEAYDRLSIAIGRLDRDLDALATVVANIQGASRDLPTKVALPQVTRTVRTVVKAAPTTHGTTRASGG